MHVFLFMCSKSLTLKYIKYQHGVKYSKHEFSVDISLAIPHIVLITAVIYAIITALQINYITII